MKKLKGFNSRIIHADYLKKDPHGALTYPLYNNAAYEFESAEQIEMAFLGKIAAHAYSRSSNPTVEHFEQKIRNITGAANVTAVGSGMAAISCTIFSLAWNGSNIVTSRHLFGNTYAFFTQTIKDLGIEVRFCDLTSADEVARNIDKNTCAVFFETISNPQLEVADIRKLKEITLNWRIPLVADSTLTPFCIFNANQFGIDLEVLSSTKIISGGASGVGGLIVDYGKFDWNNSPKLASLAHLHGQSAFHIKLRKDVYRNTGPAMSALTAYFHSLGLETMKLRFDKASANCLELATELANLSAVKSINYPGLPGSPFYALSLTQFGKLPSALLSFNLSSRHEAFNFINRLLVIRRATNLYDNKTLIIHPASTIYCDFSEETRLAMNVPDSLIRLSVGIEDVEDLLEDIYQALQA
jgi:O-acetylhomoserine (thiol)-lyase